MSTNFGITYPYSIHSNIFSLFILPEYIVEFEGNKEEPGRWEELTRVQGKKTTVILPLAPFVRYQFRVIAVNEVGRSQPSQPSDRHETPPAGMQVLTSGF